MPTVAEIRATRSESRQSGVTASFRGFGFGLGLGLVFHLGLPAAGDGLAKGPQRLGVARGRFVTINPDIAVATRCEFEFRFHLLCKLFGAFFAHSFNGTRLQVNLNVAFSRL